MRQEGQCRQRPCAVNDSSKEGSEIVTLKRRVFNVFRVCLTVQATL